MRSVRNLALGLLLALTASVASATNDYKGFPIVNVTVNGKAVQSDVPPIVMDGRTLLPVRAIVNAIGGKAEWDQATSTAIIAAPDISTLAVENVQLKEKIAALEWLIQNSAGISKEQLLEINTLMDIKNGTDLLMRQALVYQTILFKQMWYQTEGKDLTGDLMWQEVVNNHKDWMNKAEIVQVLIDELPQLRNLVLAEKKVVPSGISTYLVLTHEGIAFGNDLVSNPSQFKSRRDMTFANMGKLFDHLNAYNAAAGKRLSELLSLWK